MDLKVLHDDDFANLSACERCFSEGGGCCSGEGSGIFVTLHDVLAINKHNNLPLDEIAHFVKIEDKYLQMVKEGDPFFYKFFRDGKILQLKRENSNCKFLKEGVGCIVFDSRPSLCRFFPFSFYLKEDGEIKITVFKDDKRKNEECTILFENYYRSKGANFRAMNTSKEKLLKLFSKHVKELEVYNKYVEDLVDGRSLEEVVEKYNLSV